jgi:transposase-like protein
MSTPVLNGYPAAGKERAVQLAVASAQPRAQTTRDLGGNENTLHGSVAKLLFRALESL